MSIDRSKFKKTSASQLAQADKDLNKTMGRKDRTFSNGHQLDEGINLFRIYPVHPEIAEKDDKATFSAPFVQTFLPAMVQEKDKDNKAIMENGKPKMKLSVKPVFNSKVHANTPKDLVEEYIALANKNAKEMNLQGDDYKDYMKPIYGAFHPDPKKNVTGIHYPQAWVVYADKYANGNSAAEPVFDEWRLKKSVKERLNKIAAIEASNDPLGTEPFTDIEEGKGVKIDFNPKSETPQGYYTTELDNSTVVQMISGKPYKLPKTYPLSDRQLEHFMSQEPLQIKYGKKVAGRKNFEAQLAGLELFDQKNEMGIFDIPEWSLIVQECDSYYGDDAAVENNDTEDTDTTENAVVEEQVSGDEFDLMDRKELQTYCRENKTGILVKPSLSDDEIRDKLRFWKENGVIKHTPLPGESGYVETDPEVIEAIATETNEDKKEFLKDLHNVKPEVVKTTVSAPTEAVAEVKTLTAKERLEMLRNKSKAGASA